jgi:hypothetical protein
MQEIPVHWTAREGERRALKQLSADIYNTSAMTTVSELECLARAEDEKIATQSRRFRLGYH